MNQPSYSSKTDRSLAVTGRWLKHLIFFLIFSTISVTNAQVPNSCEAELRRAEQKYRAVELDSAVYLIRLCLNKKEATDQDKARAYKLLGKVYIARQDTTEAKKAFGKMLELNPQMTLDATQETSEVMVIFNEVKMAFEQKQRQVGKSKKWLWIGASGAAAVGAAVAILGGGGNGAGGNGGFVAPPGRPPR